MSYTLYTLSEVKVSDADSIARHVEVPAMQNDGAESFLKVCSADDGSPVGFCEWTAIEQKGETTGDGRPKQALRRATWLPEMLDQGGWISLTFMAVRPGHQRQGVGSMMMQQFCNEADLHGRCAFVLAAPEAVGLYARFGFDIVGCVEGPQGTITSMLRRPRDS
ncbi:hypothetical protein A9Z42_0076540 [Trichoderma parareesei]|uniref:N-acetyltransferase domain-containing protein n=1 Tax=Trichoderma parareesei TaxID=858221 RepID=A0A2H3A4F4_TRIPA|nr:hypothetical protein A9Z42_0076540 [Trichoderma parareesei]